MLCTDIQLRESVEDFFLVIVKHMLKMKIGIFSFVLLLIKFNVAEALFGVVLGKKRKFKRNKVICCLFAYFIFPPFSSIVRQARNDFSPSRRFSFRFVSFFPHLFRVAFQVSESAFAFLRFLSELGTRILFKSFPTKQKKKLSSSSLFQTRRRFLNSASFEKCEICIQLC